MFESFFIRKHKSNVRNYLWSNLLTKEDALCWVLRVCKEIEEKMQPKEEKPQEKNSQQNWDPNIRFSLEINKVDPAKELDRYDPELVAALMQEYFKEDGPELKLQGATNLTFVEKFLQHVRRLDLESPEIYKAAQMDRKLYSKMISDKNYHPAKDTVLALAIALQLSLSDTEDLLARAGFTLSHSIRRDVIIEYFIKQGAGNLSKINAFLYDEGEKIIGRSF